jgi:cyclopropane fatty-acyl-phospholipid synthase-like methyltransferase
MRCRDCPNLGSYDKVVSIEMLEAVGHEQLLYIIVLTAYVVARLLTGCRDCPNLGSYDKVVSIEMIEAVGHEHLVSYFATINAALKPGGKAVIQVRLIFKPEQQLHVWQLHCKRPAA